MRLPLSRLRLLDDEDEEEEEDDEERLDPEEEEELPLEEEPEDEEEELLLRLRPFLDSFSFFLPLPLSSLAGAVTGTSWEAGSFCGGSSCDFPSTACLSTVESWTVEPGTVDTCAGTLGADGGSGVLDAPLLTGDSAAGSSAAWLGSG